MSALGKCQRVITLACVVGISACRAQKAPGTRPLVVFLHGMTDANGASIEAELERRLDDTTLLAVHGLLPASGFAMMHGFPAGSLHADAAHRARSS